MVEIFSGRTRTAWRWETPLETFYGRALREPQAEATIEGCFLKAQDRASWNMDEWDSARA